MPEVGVVAGAAVRQTEKRKHILGWKCVPLMVETFGAWGRTADQFFFAQLAAQGNSTKATVLWQAKSALSSANARAFIARSRSEATTTDLLEG